MIRHVVLGAFTDEATAEQKQAMMEALRGMPAKIQQIRNLAFGLDAGLAQGNHGFAGTVDFDSAEDYQAYATHPAHVEVITNHIKPILKPGSRTAVQFPLAQRETKNAMIRHVVLGAFTDEATAEQKQAMLEALRGMSFKIPQIRSVVCGLDAGLAQGNHGFALNVDFDSVEDFQAYPTHPAHVEVITNHIKPILKPGSRTAVQFVSALKFYIFGHPVLMSPSPDIHNIGFARNGMSHVYERYDSEAVADAIQVLRGAGCGGGSVTIPHKESAMPHMDELTESAQSIGAVNTITKLAGGRLRGDNTDWLGIKNQLEAKAPPRAAGELPVALVCGAGGTARAAAFALKKMSAARVLIFNRTKARAEQLAADFGFEAIDDLSALDALARLDFVVDTLPGSTGFTLPPAQEPLLAKLRPTCLEAAYIPRHTAFVKQALGAGCRVVEGVEMLFEQGCAQCEIWTGRPAPRSAIAANLLRQLFSTPSDHPAAEKMEPRDAPPDGLTREVEAATGGAEEPPSKQARVTAEA